MPKSRHYCAAYGCKNQRTNKQLSFFTLPKEDERRKKWLEIIDRPDLMRPDIRPNSYIVCSEHFDTSSMIFIPQLKPDALPTCTQISKRDKETQTKGVNMSSIEIHKKAAYSSKQQTEIQSNQSENIRTVATLYQDTQKRRKLDKDLEDLEESELKKRKLQNILEKIKKEV